MRLLRLASDERTRRRSVPEDVRGLREVLSRRLRGEVRFDDGTRALYATTGSNYRSVPIGVVIPRDVEDVVAAVAACREFGVPIVGRGGASNGLGDSRVSFGRVDVARADGLPRRGDGEGGFRALAGGSSRARATEY